MYYLNLDEFHIVGSSPEILARLEDGKITVRPIAGTGEGVKMKKTIKLWKKIWLMIQKK